MSVTQRIGRFVLRFLGKATLLMLWLFFRSVELLAGVLGNAIRSHLNINRP